MKGSVGGEFARPLALILAALAALGWVMFGLSSWSAASVQKTQRLQIIELTEKSDRTAAELARQLEVAGALTDLEKKVAATRDDLSRVNQAKSDMQSELVTAQQKLVTLRRDLSEIDRSVRAQTDRLSEMQTGATETAEAAAPQPTVTRSFGRRGRWSRRGRMSRSFSVRTR